jgi:hypothetical protein
VYGEISSGRLQFEEAGYDHIEPADCGSTAILGSAIMAADPGYIWDSARSVEIPCISVRLRSGSRLLVSEFLEALLFRIGRLM